jgi:hypothetical protein
MRTPSVIFVPFVAMFAVAKRRQNAAVAPAEKRKTDLQALRSSPCLRSSV